MSTPLLSEIISEKPRVEVLFSDGRLFNITDLYFCESCTSLRNPLQVLETHDRFYCFNCSKNYSFLDARNLFNQCNRCFMCPICFTTLIINSHIDQITDTMYYIFQCPYCNWDSKSELSLMKNTPDSLVSILLNIEANIQSHLYFTSIINFYKKFTIEIARDKQLKSVLKDNYFSYSLGNFLSTMNQISNASINTDHAPMTKYNTVEEFEKAQISDYIGDRKDIWKTQIPEILKKSINQRAISLKYICEGNHLKNFSPKTHEETSSTLSLESIQGFFALDICLVKHSNISLVNQDNSNINNIQDINQIANHSTFMQKLQYNFRYPQTNQLETKNNKGDDILRSFNNIQNSFQSYSLKGLLPSRLPLLSRPTKQCRFCKNTLLSQKSLVNSDSNDFAIDNRALNFVPFITIIPPSILFEREKSFIDLTLYNPHEKQIQVSFKFEENKNSTIDVLSNSFEAQIGAFDHIKEIINDDEEKEEIFNSQSISSSLKRSFQNRLLVSLFIKTKENTLGQEGYFQFKLIVSFEDLLNNTHKIEIQYVICLGRIIQHTIKRTESL